MLQDANQRKPTRPQPFKLRTNNWAEPDETGEADTASGEDLSLSLSLCVKQQRAGCSPHAPPLRSHFSSSGCSLDTPPLLFSTDKPMPMPPPRPRGSSARAAEPPSARRPLNNGSATARGPTPRTQVSLVPSLPSSRSPLSLSVSLCLSLSLSWCACLSLRHSNSGCSGSTSC